MDLRSRSRSGFALASLVFLAAAALAPDTARAQCVNDGFDTLPCCTPMSPTLPVIPAVSQSARFICFRDCNPVINQGLCVDIDPPQPVNAGGIVCGLYTIKFKIKVCGGAQPILWQGNLRAHYSRNWQESQPGQPYGVWRFLLNGDLKPTAFLLSSAQGGNPNAVPVCRSSFGNNVYVSGYIDYAYECGTINPWVAAWNLNHECDTLHHQFGDPRPAPAAGLHPTRSFSWLGPGAGFVVNTTTTLTPSGALLGQAIRWNDWSTLPNICRAEESATGNVMTFGPFCICTLSSGSPGQFENTAPLTNGACGSQIQPSPVIFACKRIGQWTTPNVFPGLEYLNFAIGELGYQNGCTGAFSSEWFEGAATLGGFTATDYSGNPLGRVFMDLGSCNKNPGNMAKRVGVPHVTQAIVNLNLP